MSKTGKWSCVSQIDSNQFANIPLQVDNDFHYETDQNPAAWRPKDHEKWIGAGIIPNEKKIENFYRDRDNDTVDDFYVVKEIIFGAIVDKNSFNITGWSIVVKTVIMWEERRLRRKRERRNIIKVKQPENKKPLDIQKWESTHGTRKKRRNVMRVGRRIIRTRI